jgi:hypothetical protein
MSFGNPLEGRLFSVIRGRVVDDEDVEKRIVLVGKPHETFAQPPPAPVGDNNR